MQMRIEPFSPPDQESYLAAVEELTLELQRGIAALTAGALSDFEASLVRQHVSCVQMAELISRWSDSAADQASTMPAPADLEPANLTKAAVSALIAVNRRYFMLIKHFSETTRLFAGMFRPYGGSAGVTFYQNSHSVWSCEL